ncbi:MAG: hypothetical protein JNJ45_09645 [Chthonomonas sp.]|nr:hypothetical protein [Chthonomonas sp.]
MRQSPDQWPWDMALRAESQGVVIDPVLHHPTRPQPDPATGHLTIDPEIELKAKGFNLYVSLFYNSNSTSTDIKWGKRRSASVEAELAANETSNEVYVRRADGKIYGFSGAWSWGTPATFTAITGYVSGTKLDYDGTNFIETFADGKKIVYSQTIVAESKFTIGRVEDASGNRHTYTYAASPGSKLESITVPGGDKLTFAYDASQRVSTILDWGGRVWTLTYSSPGNELLTFQTPLGCLTQYEYDANNRLSTITDSRGYATTYAYAADGRVETMSAGTGVWTYSYATNTSVTMSPAGGRTTFILDANSNVQTMVMAAGYVVTYGYDTKFRKVRETMPYGDVVSLTYNDFNLPLTSKDALGNITTYQYDASNNLTTVTDALGNVTKMGYDGNRRMITSADPLNRVTSYIWNSDGTLQASVDPRGLRTTHSYDTRGNVLTTMYSDGGVVTYTYDALNRRTTVKDQLGRVTTMAYDVADHVISITNAAGEMRRYVYDSCLLQVEIDPLGNRTTMTYNRYAKPATIQNALNQVTTNTYDNMGDLIEVQNGLGYRTTLIYDIAKQRIAVQDANNNRVTTAYEASRPVSMINGAGIVTTTIYDARGPIASQDGLGRRTTTIYDNVGRRIATQSPMNNRTTTVYDAAGQVSAMQDALGNLTTHQYDLAGNLTTVTNALGKISTQVYSTDSNRLRASVDEVGNRTTYTFNSAGEQTAVEDPRGNRTTMTYDLAGRTKDVRNALGHFTTFTYDAAGNQTSVKDPLNRVNTTIYDALNRGYASQSPLNNRTTQVFDAAGQLTASIDAASNRWTTIYDPAGRATVSQTPLNNRTTTSYDAANRPVTVMNGRGYITTTTYDSANQVTAQKNPLGDATTYAYDLDGRQTTITNPAGGIISMVFNARGDMLAIANELNHRTTYAYDAVQRIVSRQFASGDVTTYTFDDAGRETARLYADSNRITFAYDPASNLTTMTDWNGVTTMVYDAMDDVTGKRDNFGNYQGYTFDAAGQNTSLRLQNAFVNHLTSYTYDNDGRSSGYYDLNGDYTTIQYDARNLKTTVTHPSGYIEISGFDSDHRQISQISEAGMDTFQDFTFGYDANGNRNSVFDAVLAVTTTYSFDAGDRITLSQANASLAHTFTYAYDSRGNIINSSESGVMVTSTYDAASRLVTSTRGSAVTTYTFDANGNMTQVQEPSVTRNFSYDKENRVTQGGGLSQTSYNGFGEMISSEDENFGITAQICWDTLGNVVMQANDVADDFFPYIVVDGRVYWDSRTGDYMVDALGSVTGIMSSSAKQTQDYRYAPYGRILLSHEGGGPPLVYRYVGSLGVRSTVVRYLENHMRARIFSTTTSQFTTRDPLWPEELAYGYVNGNPVTWIDPSGAYTVRPINCKGCGKTLVITPEKGDSSGIIDGPPRKGGGTALIGGRGCQEAAKKLYPGKKCICVNGGFFAGHNPMGPLDPIGKPRVGGCGTPAPDPKTRKEWPVVTDDGFVTGIVGTPPSPGPRNNPGRTGACVDRRGKLVSLIIAEGCAAETFRKCAEKQCPSGSTFVWLDGGGSSQVWGPDGKPILGGNASATGKPDWRAVDNWIIICEQ